MPKPTGQRGSISNLVVSRVPLDETPKVLMYGGDGWTLYPGDCLKHLGELRAAQTDMDLIFADPPFNINYEYDVYNDNRPAKEYLEWCRQWISLCYQVLRPIGIFCLSIGPKYQAHLRVMSEECGFTWRETIAWHYTFGPSQKGKFTPSWVPIHVFTKDLKGRCTWNPEAVKVPSLRQLKYRDKRATKGGKTPDNFWVLDPQSNEDVFQLGQDSWLESRVCGTFKERTDHPAQMPESVLRRLIRAYSNQGDLVLDPFVGSGTTLAAALRENRKAIGIELSENYCTNIILPRLQGVVA